MGNPLKKEVKQYYLKYSYQYMSFIYTELRGVSNTIEELENLINDKFYQDISTNKWYKINVECDGCECYEIIDEI